MRCAIVNGVPIAAQGNFIVQYVFRVLGVCRQAYNCRAGLAIQKRSLPTVVLEQHLHVLRR